MRRFFLLFFFLFLLPCLVKAGTADLSLSQGSIDFSKDILIVGDTVRVYATVKNIGEVDVSGYVAFFQGSLPIGDSQVISLRVSGSPEDVYVDFVVPSGTFNLRAEIRGTDPEDENEANNVVITQLFTPIFDDDRDGLENDEDNCPAVENPDQADADRDGLGDVCDDDDDNDGLTDSVEKEIGTSPTSSDTDGDGLPDASDSNPTVAGQSSAVKEPAPKVEATPFVSSAEEETIKPNDSLVTDETMEQSPELEPVEVVPEMVLLASPKAVFTYQQKNWQTFDFYTKLPSSDGYRVSWNLGDGTTSSKAEVEHVYQKSGDYLVKILIEGPDGQTAEDSMTIHIPFFSLENPLVQLIVVSLFFAIFVLLYLFRRAGRLPPPSSVSKSEGVKISVRHDHAV